MDNLTVCNFNRIQLPAGTERVSSRKPYIEFGDDNLFPDFLIDIANRSALHNAIISSKVDYAFGNGLRIDENGKESANLSTRLFVSHPNEKESLDEVYRKMLYDIIMFGGCSLNVIWAKDGEHISKVYHVPFDKIRSGKRDERGNVNEYYYCDNWAQERKYGYKMIQSLDSNNRSGSQLVYWKDYRPGTFYYPLPSYVGAINYIKVDSEISNFHLSHLLNGMAPNFIISLNNGIPSEEEQKQIKKQFVEEFTGTDNAGKFILSFSDSKDKAPDVTLLSSDNLDEQFIQLQATVLQNILAGHKVVSPLLVGIKTEGQLGGASELDNAYRIYEATVINKLRMNALQVLNNLIVDTLGYTGAELVATNNNIQFAE